MARILLAEDNFNLQTSLFGLLNQAQHEIFSIRSIDRLEELIATTDLDLLIADRHLLGGDFFEILPQLNLKNYSLKTLLISQTNCLSHRLTAFAQGINDILAKPFALKEFHLRVNNLLALEKTIVNDFIYFGKLKYYPHLGIIEKQTVRHRFCKKEHKIFALLLKKRGLAVSTNQIIDYIWPKEKQAQKNTVEVYIRRIRAKLFDQASKLVTLRGLGYKLL